MVEKVQNVVKANKAKKWPAQIGDPFWNARVSQMCGEIIPYQYEVLNDQAEGVPESHAIENFRIAAGLSEGEYHGMLFQDSDVAKWIEAAAYSLRIRENEELEKKIDEVVGILEKAQKPDGYLNTYYTCVHPEERLKNIAHGHEMYCAGHLAEAAVALAQAAGKTALLDIVERYIGFLMANIGPEPGMLHICPGHPELELALYKLYQYTGKKEYLDFMEYLLLERGKQPSFFLTDPGFGEQYHDKWFGLEYHQAHLPLLEQKEAKGHAVRAMYLYAGLADLAYEKKDPEMMHVLDSLWEDVTEKKMYLTGAVGSDEHGECFSVAYDLPADRAYAETCASIGLIFWARRMLRLRLDSRYGDVMETALYNGAISGMSSDGKTYFYVNPLMMIPEQAENRYDLRHVKPERAAWFGCACCPPNLARLTASLPAYICDYDPEKKELDVHLYIGGIISPDGAGFRFDVSGNYAEEGKMTFRYCGEPEELTLRLRLPGWSRHTSLLLGGKKQEIYENAGYAEIRRKWLPGDILEMEFDITPGFVYAHPSVASAAGRAAVRKGPFVYCLEEADNGPDLNALTVTGFCTDENQDGFSGSETGGSFGARVYLTGFREKPLSGGKLYSDIPPLREAVTLCAVPYYTWGNRGKGEMLVWFRK